MKGVCIPEEVFQQVGGAISPVDKPPPQTPQPLDV